MTTSDLRPAPPRLPLVLRCLLPVLVLLGVLFGVRFLFGAILPADAPQWLLRVVPAFVGTALIVVAAILLVRHVDRRPPARLRIGLDRRTLPRVLYGIALGGLALGGTAAVAALLGASAPDVGGTPLPEVIAAVPFLLVQAFVLQAIPEEVLFRGYLIRTSAERLPVWGVAILSSALFGVIHILSQSPADTVAERLLYVVAATGLGALATAARLASGSVWPAVGVHGGFHLATFATWLWQRPEPELYGVYLAVLAVVQVLIAAVLLRGAVRSGRLDWSGRLGTAA